MRSLAVLPLENLSPGPDDDFFADGMTDALITTLAQIRALRVISRTSVMRYKGARQPLPEIAQALNVDAIVEGTVLRSQGRVRIAAQLIHAASDTHLWAKQYESDLRDVLALQSDVARAIADEIQMQLSPQERSRLARSRPVDPAAYEAFLKGRHFWYRRSPDALAQGRSSSCSRRSASIPAHALAHAGLAEAHASMGWDLFGLSAPSESFPQGQTGRSDERSRSIPTAPKPTPRSAGHGNGLRLGLGDGGTGVSARDRSQASVRPGPHLVLAPPESHGSHRGVAGREPARARVRPARPGAEHAHGMASASIRGSTRRPSSNVQKTLELDPTFILAHVFLGQAYEQSGAFSSAIAAFEKAVELSRRHPTYLADLGHGFAVAGRRADALNVLDELHEMSSQRYVAAQGHRRDSYRPRRCWTRRSPGWSTAFQQRNGWLIHISENPRYDRLRGDPRYLDLVRRMNFPRRAASERPALTAVHDDRRAADPARARRGEERDDVADFVGSAEAAERQLALHELGDRRRIVLLALPPRSALEQNRPRRHAVDADVGRAPAAARVISPGRSPRL